MKTATVKRAKKAVVRKKRVSSARKSAARAPVCAGLHDAPPEQCFWINHGPILKNMDELREALSTMTDEQYRHHAGGGKNDFATWLSDVLQHHACAEKMRRAKTRAGAIKALGACGC